MNKTIEKNPKRNSKVDCDKETKHNKEVPEFSSINPPKKQQPDPACNSSKVPLTTQVYGHTVANSTPQKS